MVSPSIEAGKAKMTSFTSVDCTRVTNDSTVRSAGPTPSMGLMTPPKMWYNPRYSPTDSKAKRSRMSSTTHNVELSR